jgi:hypothetical protein
MVHALEEIHRLLKPGGFLIDIHPVSEPSFIEIHHSGNIDLVGQLTVHQWCVDFEGADNALSEIVQRGLFTVEHKRMFDTLTYYDSAEEMGTSLKESIHIYARDAQSAEKDVPQAEALAGRAEELLRAAPSEAALVLRERDHISRLKPI